MTFRSQYLKKHEANVLVDHLNVNLDKLRAKKKGILFDLILYWPDIVGEKLSQGTRPKKIIANPTQVNGKLLLVETIPKFALNLQYQSLQVTSSINQFFGYKAVDGIKLSQVKRFISSNTYVSNYKKIDDEKISKAYQQLSSYENEPLRQKLAHLLAAINSQ